ncbi:MAG: sulfatase [Bacteroidales bacterium]
MKIDRLAGLGITSLLGISGFAQQNDKPNTENPNIILVYLDDMGYGDLPLTGATGYQTPNIDLMAKEGMFFSHFYAPQAVSSASRAGLLTGCYPNRIGFAGALDHNSKIGINSAETTIPELLKTKGYKTAAFGKWHLGCQKQFLPKQHGFDEFFGIPYSHDMWPNHPTSKNYYPPLPLFEGDSVIYTNPDNSKFTYQFTDRTVNFIRQNKNKPFFIYLAHPLPHVPLAVSDKFRGKSSQGLYGDVMMEIDWSLGQIVQTLKETGLDNKTLIIFTSDNGPWLNYGNHAGSAGGLREGKGTSYEGGQRVPCLMRWKGVIPEGMVCNKLCSAIDILATLAAITNSTLPPDKIDGVNIFPLMLGHFEENPRKSFYYYYRQNSLEAVTNGDWKLVFPHPGRSYEGFNPGNNGMPGIVNENFGFNGGLFDLRRDPGERYDVKPAYPEIVEMLEKIAQEAHEDLGDDLTNQKGKNRREPGRIKNE